jgi:hypothetical protein
MNRTASAAIGKWALGCVLALGLCVSPRWASALVWQTDKETAMSQALSQGKYVLLVAGRYTCGNTRYMTNIVCESTSPNVVGVIQQSYVPWFCNIDASADYWTYAAGMSSFTLPLICCINPANPGAYLDRSTGTTNATAFYNRLAALAPGLWSGATDLGGGWKSLPWFGYFCVAGGGWIYHNEHGWMYAVGTSASSIWLWTADMGWLWTKSTIYPYLYRHSGAAWLWYQVGTSGPRWFMNLNTQNWESWYPPD